MVSVGGVQLLYEVDVEAVYVDVADEVVDVVIDVEVFESVAVVGVVVSEVLVVVSELVLSVVVDIVESEVLVVSRPRISTRSRSSRISTNWMTSSKAGTKDGKGVAAIWGAGKSVVAAA